MPFDLLQMQLKYYQPPEGRAFSKDFTTNVACSAGLWPKKINVLFPETSEYFLGSVGRQILYFKNIFYIGKA